MRNDEAEREGHKTWEGQRLRHSEGRWRGGGGERKREGVDVEKGNLKRLFDVVQMLWWPVPTPKNVCENDIHDTRFAITLREYNLIHSHATTVIIYSFKVVILHFSSLFLLHYILEEIFYFLLHNNNLTYLVSLQIKILTYKHITYKKFLKYEVWG